jgi:hypothetical protein
MDINIISNGINIAYIKSNHIVLSDPNSALDLIATINYTYNCNHIILDIDLINPDFFNLSTRIAGEILQKFINYNTKLAVVGDFSIFDSKSLKDFIYESNKGNCIFFANSKDNAIKALKNAF